MAAFTLIELLVVMVIVTALLALAVPALKSLKGGGDFTKAAYDVAGTLETARAYSMANATYTWVGFYEEDASVGSATNATPSYPGKGRVLLAVVASKDGTVIVDDANTASVALDPSRIVPVGKLVRIEGIHLTDLGAPAPNATAPLDSLDNRSGIPHQGADSVLNLISSDNPQTTLRPFAAQGYTFYKSVRFNPRGEANIGELSSKQRLPTPAHGGDRPPSDARRRGG